MRSLLVFYLSRAFPPLHSFPTRRSSDLSHSIAYGLTVDHVVEVTALLADGTRVVFGDVTPEELARDVAEDDARSEEHTSELQSRSDLVCRLLPEKKNPARTSERSRQTAS